VKELKDDLRKFIFQKLREAECPCSFDKIHQWVTAKFGGFFTKEFIFRAIDLLFQDGKILETERLVYEANYSF
jgi:hypothetical protein